ncbi:Flp family type IVb pilin [Candidatus Poriferisodalis sp.]|uniref:Flp family type IVb pilin n=1 Tax=Candidatus Poriferisodalis sp. TaxID=3101277 RepID=UPI003B02DF15
MPHHLQSLPRQLPQHLARPASGHPTRHSTVSVGRSHQPLRRTHRLEADQSGQTTAEYALLTGAIALLVAAVTAWATSTGKVGRLLDAVFNYLTKAIS